MSLSSHTQPVEIDLSRLLTHKSRAWTNCFSHKLKSLAISVNNTTLFVALRPMISTYRSFSELLVQHLKHSHKPWLLSASLSSCCIANHIIICIILNYLVFILQSPCFHYLWFVSSIISVGSSIGVSRILHD